MKNKIIQNIFLTIIVLYVSFNILAIENFIIEFDSNWNTIINIIYFILLTILQLIVVWNKKYKDKIKKIIIFLTIICAINIVYYKCFSTKLEAKIYFHKKYHVPYKDLKKLKSKKIENHGLFGYSRIKRTVILEYNNYNIEIYYNDGWKDDYTTKVNNKDN